jgi:RNA polymerase sigma factor (sigma-70 family)
MEPADRDRILIRTISTTGADGALGEILRRHGPMVMGVCRRVLGDYHESEDAFQATFIVLIRKRHSLILRKSIGAWLHGVALRVATKAKEMSPQRKVESVITDEGPLTQELDHVERLAWSEIGQILDEEIQRLPAKLRSAFVLCELEGRTHKDAAKEFGIPLGTVSSRVALAKEKLRSNLTRRGVTITSAGLTAAIASHASAALSAGQLAAALKTAAIALSGKTSSVAASAFALALADAVGRSMTAGKLLLGSVVIASVMVGMAAAVVLRISPTSPQPVAGAPFADPIMLSERALLHLGDLAFRHRSHAAQVTYLPQGDKIVTICPYNRSHSVHLWDAETGRKLWEFQGSQEQTAQPRCLAVSPSGELLAVGKNNGEVTVLDVETGSLLSSERPDDRAVTAITFTPDGSQLITADMDGVVRAWSATDLGQAQREWRVIPAEQVAADHFIGDGADIRGPRASVIAVSGDGKRIAIGDGALGAIYICDAETGKRLTTIEKAHGRRLGAPYSCVNTLRFTPDGKQLISGGYRMVPRNTTTIEHGANNVQLLEVRLWDVETGGLVSNLVNVDVWSEGYLAISPNCESFAVSDYADVLHFWHMGDATPHHSMSLPGQGMALSPDGTTIAMATGHGITFWDAQTAERQFHDAPPRYSGVHDIAWSSRNERLAIGYGDGVELWDAATGEMVDSFELGEPGVEYRQSPANLGLAFSNDERLLVTAGQRVSKSSDIRGIIQVWDTSSLALRKSIAIEAPLQLMTLADDGSAVGVVTRHIGWTYQLSVYELPSGKLLGQYPKEVDDVLNNDKEGFPNVVTARIVAESTKVHIACEDGFCFHWDYVSHRPGAGFFADERTDGRASKLKSALFSLDGKILATSGPGKLCLWSTHSQSLEHMEVVPMANRWLDLGFSRDGRRLAGADVDYFLRDNTIRIWDLTSRNLELSWQVPQASARNFAFSPDKTRLATALDRGTVVIWDVRESEP